MVSRQAREGCLVLSEIRKSRSSWPAVHPTPPNASPHPADRLRLRCPPRSPTGIARISTRRVPFGVSHTDVVHLAARSWKMQPSEFKERTGQLQSVPSRGTIPTTLSFSRLCHQRALSTAVNKVSAHPRRASFSLMSMAPAQGRLKCVPDSDAPLLAGGQPNGLHPTSWRRFHRRRGRRGPAP